MLKRVWAVLPCFVALLVLAMSIEAPAEKITIWAYATVPKCIEQLTPEFEAKNPGAKVELVSMGPWDLADKVLIASAAGKGAPDLAVMVTRRFLSYVEAGCFTEITEELKESGYLDKYIPSIIQMHAYEGEIYGAPQTTPNTVIWYRKDIFNELGLDTEDTWQTWDGFIDAGKKFKEQRYRIFYMWSPVSAWGANFYTQFLASMGGRVYNADGSVVENNETAIKWFQWLYDIKFEHDIALSGKFITPQHWANLSSGAVITHVVPLWGKGELQQYTSPKPGMWGVKPFPLWGKDAPNLTGQWGNHCFAIHKQSEQKELSWKFIEFYLSNPEVVFEVTGALQPTIGILDAPFMQREDPLTGQILANVLKQRTLSPWYYFNWAESAGIISKALNDMFADKVSPEEAWINAEKELKKLSE